MTSPEDDRVQQLSAATVDLLTRQRRDAENLNEELHLVIRRAGTRSHPPGITVLGYLEQEVGAWYRAKVNAWELQCEQQFAQLQHRYTENLLSCRQQAAN